MRYATCFQPIYQNPKLPNKSWVTPPSPSLRKPEKYAQVEKQQHAPSSGQLDNNNNIDLNMLILK
jgi:hypothetical protein